MMNDYERGMRDAMRHYSGKRDYAGGYWGDGDKYEGEVEGSMNLSMQGYSFLSDFLDSLFDAFSEEEFDGRLNVRSREPKQMPKAYRKGGMGYFTFGNYSPAELQKMDKTNDLIELRRTINIIREKSSSNFWNRTVVDLWGDTVDRISKTPQEDIAKINRYFGILVRNR